MLRSWKVAEQLRLADSHIDSLVASIEKEKPDLIIYDELAGWAKFAMLLLRHKHANNAFTTTFRLPAVAMFRSTIVRQSSLNGKRKLGFFDYISMVVPLVRLLMLNMRHGLWVVNLFSFLWHTEEELNIVSVLPAIQPNAHLVSESNRFVGSCFKEEMRLVAVQEPELQLVLDTFEPCNPLSPCTLDQVFESRTTQLVYVSFGTVFNNQEVGYSHILDAFVEHMNDSIVTYQVVMAVGSPQLVSRLRERLSALCQQHQQQRHSICIVTFAPQIEVLKRASLFVTHCGMGSTR